MIEYTDSHHRIHAHDTLDYLLARLETSLPLLIGELIEEVRNRRNHRKGFDDFDDLEAKVIAELERNPVQSLFELTQTFHPDTRVAEVVQHLDFEGKVRTNGDGPQIVHLVNR